MFHQGACRFIAVPIAVYIVPNNSQLGCAFRFELGQERLTPRRASSGNTNRGGNLAIASLADGGQLDGFVVATTTVGPTGTPSQDTLEVRQLIDGGLAHSQVRGGILVGIFPLWIS